MATARKPTLRIRPAASSKRRAARESDKDTETTSVLAELQQLRSILERYPPLTSEEARAFDELYTEEQYRAFGELTRAPDTFRGAMAWARTLGEHRDDRALSPRKVRWFLDCLYALGQALQGSVTPGNPSHRAQLDVTDQQARRMIQRVERRLRAAVGGRRDLAARIDAALEPPDVGHVTAHQARSLASLCRQWLAGDHRLASVSLMGIEERTAVELEQLAQRIDQLVRVTPAAQPVPRDSPTLNALEGRLLRIMRILWDDVAEAREDGLTTLQFVVSPAILRGLNLRHRRQASTESVNPPAT